MAPYQTNYAAPQYGTNYYPAYNYQPQQNQNNGIIWVQGLAGAKSYLITPGTNVLLMDSENPVFYIKSADAAGMPMPLRVFDYKERKEEPEPKNDERYVTRQEYQNLLERYTDLEMKLNRMKGEENANTIIQQPEWRTDAATTWPASNAPAANAI